MYLYIDFALLHFSPVLNLLMSETTGLKCHAEVYLWERKVEDLVENGKDAISNLLPKTIVVQYFKYLCLLIKGNKLLTD